MQDYPSGVTVSCSVIPAILLLPIMTIKTTLLVAWLVSAPRVAAQDEEGIGRSFLFKEVVLSGFLSFRNVAGLPLEDPGKERIGVSRRPPGTYIGLDYVKTFTPSSGINKILPDWLPATAMNLHPRIVYLPEIVWDRSERITFAPQDFWIRFNPAGADRLMLRVGQFVIPFGANPILAPRQQFLLPVEATDLGLKWDWGLDLKGPVGEFDWEVALTIGSGEDLRLPHFFSGSDRASYLITGRVGSPSYWDFQYGLSFLYGDLPAITGPRLLSDVAISRWRVGYDAFYKYGTYLMAGAQLTYGQDGFVEEEVDPRRWAEIAGPVRMTHGVRITNALSYRAWLDWVVPWLQEVRLAFQFESIHRAVSMPASDNTALIFELGYSLTTAITAKLDYREQLSTAIGQDNDAVYLTAVFYRR